MQAITQAISIPDVNPSSLPPGSNFSLVAGTLPLVITYDIISKFYMCYPGDFEEVFGVPEQAEEWDAILTCFFIDTVRDKPAREFHALTDRDLQAKNIISYLRILHRILAPGGVWINLGISL